jgi:O-antigen/teichoic acid export membrane protein
MAIITILTAGFYYSYIKYRYSFVHFHIKKAEWNQFKEIGKSGLYIFLLSMNVIVAYNGDNLILSILIGTGSVALYSIAFKIIKISQVMIDSFSNVLFPVIAEFKAKNESEKLKWLHYKGVKLGFACSVLVAVLYSVFGEEIISVWVKKENFVGSNVVYVLSFWLVLICTSFPTSNILLILGKEKWFGLLATFTTLINLILSFILVKKLGIIGTALATVAAACFSYFFVILWETKILKDSFFKYLKNSIIPILGPALLLGVFSIILKRFIVSLMSGSSRIEAAFILVFSQSILSVIYFLIIYYLGTDKEEKDLFYSKFLAFKARLNVR